MGARQTVVIVGAGTAGLTAALALASRGFAVVVAERAGEITEIGAGIQIAPNAGKALARLGLEDAISAAATEPVAIDLIDGASGRPLTSIATSQFRERYGFPYRVMRRTDLQSILVAAVERAGGRLMLGAVVDDMEVMPDGVRVRVRADDDVHEIDAALIVAADGVWSTMRQRVPGAAQPTSTGYTAWRAMISADAAGGAAASNRVGLWFGPGAHLVHYPVGRQGVVNVVAIVEDKGPEGEPGGDGDALARRWFGSWAADATRFIRAASSWRKHPIATVDPAGPWTCDRMVLIGDAAHAMPPFLAQGAAMAIEDAVVLADALDGANNDIEAGMKAFVRARRPRVAEVLAASRRAGDVYHMGGIMAAARNAALRVAGEALVLSRNDAIYRWHPDRTNQ